LVDTIFILIFRYRNQLKIKVMLVDIINTVFSLPYLAIGVTIAAVLDIAIHYTKVTTRFTLIQIWGCTMCWPAVLVLLFFAFIFGQKK